MLYELTDINNSLNFAIPQRAFRYQILSIIIELSNIFLHTYGILPYYL